MKVSLFLFVVLAFAGNAFSQEPLKFADVGNEKESTSVFVERLEAFIDALLKGPKTTTGFIAISGEDYPTLEERLLLVRRRVKNRPELKGRMSFSEPGNIYDKNWPASEFWLIPDGADGPYKLKRAAHIACPSIQLIGSEVVTTGEKIVFTASVNGFPDIIYRWSVTGGKIINGLATPSIVVRANKSNTNSVTATIEIGDEFDLLERGYCITKASFTTKIEHE